MSILIPSQTVSPPAVLPDNPFQRLTSLARADLAATRNLPAAERRLLTDHFVSAFQWETIRPLLPLQLELSPGVLPWRARMCRSRYIWLPPDDIHCADDLLGLDNFDLVLRLFDFSPWRPILGQRFSSAYGSPPFDPVGIGLACLLVRWRNWTWPQASASPPITNWSWRVPGCCAITRTRRGRAGHPTPRRRGASRRHASGRT